MKRISIFAAALLTIAFVESSQAQNGRMLSTSWSDILGPMPKPRWGLQIDGPINLMNVRIEAFPPIEISDLLLPNPDLSADMGKRMKSMTGTEKRCVLNVRIEEEMDGGGFSLRKISSANEPGAPV